jgi:signal transduction histidine kinase
VRTDPTHLRQIIVNLIGNAVKYTETGGITVRARLVEGAGPPQAGRLDGQLVRRPPLPPNATPGTEGKRLWIALQVIDTGLGIAPEDHERVFEEFEQVNAGPRGDSMARGTGLGLPISRRLARLLGGDVTLESEPGRGSAFALWLPVHPADVRTSSPPAGVAKFAAKS